MKFSRSLRTAVGALLCMSMFNSCYFNSAGHIVRAASYNATVDTGELKANSGSVYTDGVCYYVEMMRYRFEKPVTTQYSAFDTDSKPKTPQMTAMGRQMYRIDADFADYLTGRSSSYGSSKPVAVSESKESIAARCTAMPITRTANSTRHDYQHSSPAAFWLYTAAGFDWLCVDLPVTCVENSLVIAGAATLGALMILSYDPAQKYREAASEGRSAMLRATELNRDLTYLMANVRSPQSANALAPEIARLYSQCAHYEGIASRKHNYLVNNHVFTSGQYGLTSSEQAGYYSIYHDYEAAREAYAREKTRLDLNDFYGSRQLLNIFIHR